MGALADGRARAVEAVLTIPVVAGPLPPARVLDPRPGTVGAGWACLDHAPGLDGEGGVGVDVDVVGVGVVGVGVVGVGVDVVSVAEVSASLTAGGAAYLRRIFSPVEVGALTRGGPASSVQVAARFALKECVTKILDPRDDPWPWGAVELDGGWLLPQRLRLSAAPAAAAASSGLTRLHAHVSTSSCADGTMLLATGIGLGRVLSRPRRP